MALAAMWMALPAGGVGAGEVPTADDISWTADGNLMVKDWLLLEERYGEAAAGTNQVLRKTADTIEYQNALVRISKRWRLEDDTLVVAQEITPRNEAGRHSELTLQVKTLRPFDRFFTPYAFSSPEISGEWIEAGAKPELKCGYHGAYSNSMLYYMLHGRAGGVMFDRVLSDGYLAWEGGIRRAAGDFSELTWPMLGYGHWSWNRGHPGPIKDWMQNTYPAEGGSAEYRLHFFDPGPREEMGNQAYGRYLDTRKEVARERKIFQGWEKVHRPTDDTIAFYTFAGYNWDPVGIAGMGGYSGPEKLTRATPYYVDHFKRMRAILDENGLADAYIYFWLHPLDGLDAGWGHFPLDIEPTKALFAKLRDDVHHIRLGAYVNFWLCATHTDVYQQHPDWFTTEYHKTDRGSDAYAGKLPEWGNFMVEQIPGYLEAYGLDFIFFDGADWAPRWRGTHEQSRKFFTDMSNMLHDNGAEFWANGNIPFVDMGMDEQVAGESVESDRILAENFRSITYHERMMGPMFSWRSWKPLLFFRSGQSLLDHFADRPEFLVRWPVHYAGEEMDYVLEHYFTPFAKRRAAALGAAGSR